jgi:hypothetical protein
MRPVTLNNGRFLLSEKVAWVKPFLWQSEIIFYISAFYINHTGTLRVGFFMTNGASSSSITIVQNADHFGNHYQKHHEPDIKQTQKAYITKEGDPRERPPGYNI